MANLKTKKTVSAKSKKESAQQYSSSTFKAIAAEHDARKITTTQAINKIVPKGTPQKIRDLVAKALGTQIGKITIEKIDQKLNKKFAKKTQTRKPSK